MIKAGVIELGFRLEGPLPANTSRSGRPKQPEATRPPNGCVGRQKHPLATIARCSQSPILRLFNQVPLAAGSKLRGGVALSCQIADGLAPREIDTLMPYDKDTFPTLPNSPWVNIRYLQEPK